jgi:subtilisin family serine protease
MAQFPGRAGERGDVARAWARVEWLAGTAARATLGAAARAMGVHLVAAVAAPLLVGCSDAVSPVGPSGGGPAVRAAVPSSPAAGDPMPDEYIITFRDSVGDPTGLARRTVAEHGGTLRFAYGAALKGFAAHLPAQAAEALRRNPQVARVEQDYSIPLAEVQDGVEWGLDRIDQRSRPLDYQYSYSSTGSGVSVYIIDTGIRMSHAQFGGRAVPGYTSVNDGRGGGDCTGHGTHVAGIVGSRAYGVAKAATVVSVRVYDCNNVATLSGMLAGVDWVTKNARKPAVANMSLGGAYSATLNQSVQTRSSPASPMS